MAKPYKTYRIETRSIHTRAKDGKRLHPVHWGVPVRWERFPTPASNFRDAVRQVTNLVHKDHVGYIVYRRVLKNGLPTNDVKPLYKAKWGNNGSPYIEYTTLGIRWQNM